MGVHRARGREKGIKGEEIGGVISPKINVGIFSGCMFFREIIKQHFSQYPDLKTVYLEKIISENLLSLTVKPNLILLCYSGFHQLGAAALKNIHKENSLIKFIICNVEENEEEEILELFDFGVRGIIYRNDTISMIIEAIRKIHYGEVWLKRENMSRMLTHNDLESNNHSSEINRNGLTSREVEIMGLISGGHKNITVAKKLNVTENTIKFHLKNIFKKLSCKNKINAINHFSQKQTYPRV